MHLGHIFNSSYEVNLNMEYELVFTVRLKKFLMLFRWAANSYPPAYLGCHGVQFHWESFDKILVELGLNEQVPKVEKKSNCDYFRLKYIQNKQSLKEQIITQIQKQIL